MNRALRRQQKKLSKKAAVPSADPVVVLQQGIEFHKVNELDKAEQCYKRALEINPNNSDALHLYGTLLHQKGDDGAAIPYLESAIAKGTGNSNYHNILGLALKNVGKTSEAIDAFKSALLINANFAPALNSLGVTYKEMGEFEKAKTALEKSIEIAPDSAEYYNSLGSMYEAAGRFKEAIAAYEQGIETKSASLILYYNMGNAYFRNGDPAKAAELYKFVISKNPNFAGAQSNYGLMLRKLGRHAEAVEPIQKACELEPNSAERYYNLGLALASVGQSRDAISCFEGALRLDPEHKLAHNDLGLALVGLGFAHKAAELLEIAVSRMPESAGFRNNLGHAYLRSGQLEKAKETIGVALQMDDQYSLAYNNLGVVHQELAEFDAALENFEKALEIDPNYHQAMSNLLFTLNYDPDKTGEEIFEHYKAYNETYAAPLAVEQRPHSNDADPTRRIRVGYVASTFHQHAITMFLMPLFDRFDHVNFEVYTYADLSKVDKFSEQYKANSDHFILTTGMSDVELTKRIRDDKIDILLDIAGHTKANRLKVFARKPAPISIHWLDFGYTTGMPAIDYYMGDPVSTPQEQDHLFGEKEVWRVDGPSFVYRPNPGMGEVSELPATKNGYITFCTLSRSVRMNSKLLRVWAEVLKAVPDSKLRMDSRNFDDATMCGSIRRQFEEFGVDPDRLILGYNSPPWDTLRDVDIAFDCFPHNSGTTLYEHLYMGNPYVTLYNRASVGTLGATILRGAGYPEWVANTEQEYIDIAVKLASDLPALAKTRAELREKFENSEMMDEEAFVKRFETAYRQMWQKWCEEQ